MDERCVGRDTGPNDRLGVIAALKMPRPNDSDERS